MLSNALQSTKRNCSVRTFSMCADVLEALREDSPPDIILLDIVMPLMSGIEAIPFIKSLAPVTDIIMLTGFDEDEKIFSSLSIGANGYLLKNSPINKILEGIDEVLNGGAAMSPSIAKKVLQKLGSAPIENLNYGLTPREKQILSCLVEEPTKEKIAEKLDVSFYTIQTHIKNIYFKLRVHNRSEAVVKALREKLL